MLPMELAIPPTPICLLGRTTRPNVLFSGGLAWRGPCYAGDVKGQIQPLEQVVGQNNAAAMQWCIASSESAVPYLFFSFATRPHTRKVPFV